MNASNINKHADIHTMYNLLSIFNTLMQILYMCVSVYYIYTHTHMSRTNHLGLNNLCGYLVLEEASFLSQYKDFTHT